MRGEGKRGSVRFGYRKINVLIQLGHRDFDAEFRQKQRVIRRGRQDRRGRRDRDGSRG